MDNDKVLILTILTFCGILSLIFSLAYFASAEPSKQSISKVATVSLSSIVLSLVFFGIAATTQNKYNREDCIKESGIWTKRESEPYYHAGMKTITVDREYSCD